MGRSSKYTDELAREIVERIIHGESLLNICKDKKMPSYTTVYDWLDKNDRFSKQVARAREISADTIEGKIIDVIERTTPENAKASKVIMDALFKIAAQRNPRRYGEKRQLEHTSPDQSMSNQITVEIVKPFLDKD